MKKKINQGKTSILKIQHVSAVTGSSPCVPHGMLLWNRW